MATILAQNNKISLYIHWPFCKSKCPYCDFNSHVGGQIDADRWLLAYQKQLDSFAYLLDSKVIDTIYFGGGTPSLAPTSVIGGILEYLYKNYNIAENAEITLEANPTSIEMQKFASLQGVGINRISVGIQSLRDKHLKFLGREHSSTEALKALELAKHYFDNTSFDLMYCLPDQTLSEWMEDLKFASDILNHHISLYQLTIEKGTKFYKAYNSGEFVMPGESLSADFYDNTVAYLENIGMHRYEVSNHAAHGYESRHNIAYWQYYEFLGIGPGAHSRLMIDDKYHAIMMHHAPNKWLETIENHNGIQQQQVLDERTVLEERIMMGMRTREGIPKHLLLDRELKLQHLINDGFLFETKGRVAATDQGFKLLNQVVLELVNS